MENKFYYKTPAVLLMMFAAHQGAAMASEHETQSDIEQSEDSSQQTLSVNEANDAIQTPQYNVVKTIDASQPKSLTVYQTKKDNSAELAPAETATLTDVSQAPSESDNKNAEVTENQNQVNEDAVKEASENQLIEHAEPEHQPSSLEEQAQPVTTEAPIEAVPVEETVAEKATTQAAAFSEKSVQSTQSSEPKLQLKTAQPVKQDTVQPAARTVSKTLSQKQVQKAVGNMSVNDYINYMNYQAPVIKEDYSSHIPKLGYRKGVGKPEGLVAHETANNTSTIWGEVQYMKNNYQNAFVHAYVDDNNIIETAPTDYLAWGAGAVANERFIHVELVRVHGAERFAKSINNYADYIATNLLYYNLPVDSAEYDGNGTLWSHKAVSNYLGGTDHTDPYGWFAQNGYTFDELTQLVTQKYNTKLTGIKQPVTPSPKPAPSPAPPKAGAPVTTAQSKLVRVKSKSVPYYTAVTDANGTVTPSKYGVTYASTKQAKYNGKTYHLLNDVQTGIARGWVEAGNVTVASKSAESATAAKFIISSKVSGLYSTPWGTSMQKIDTLKSQINKAFNPTKKVTVNKSIYYFGTINSLTGWIPGTHLTPVTASSVTNVKTIDLTGRTTKTNSGAVVYTDAKISKKAAAKSADMQYFIDKEAMKGSTKYYQIVDGANKAQGWVRAADIKTSTHKINDWKKEDYVINGSAYLYSIPNGSTKQRITPLKAHTDKKFSVVRTDQVGTAKWHKGTIAGTNLVGWISGKYLSKIEFVKQKAPESLKVAVDKQMKLVNQKTNSGPKVVYASNGNSLTRFASRAEVQKNMETKNFINDPAQKYQFLKLNQSQNIKPETLNKLLKGKGVLEGQGSAFAKASKDLGINEVYLISHALLETGNGTSQLSKGNSYASSTKKYYNMYGTRATDNNALQGGVQYAYQNGWDTPAKAIIGGAKYVSKNYFENQQFTLHQMRWNPAKTATHQYATDINWAVKNASRIADFYKQLGLQGLKFFAHLY